METIRLFLADDHTVVRQGLRHLLEAEPDISVVGEAGTGREAVHLTRKLRPDVMVMDIAMPRLNGLEAARQIARAMPAVRVLVLSSYSDDGYIRRLTEIGAAGYLLKQTAAADLIRAVREAGRGRTFFSPAVSRRLLEHSRGFSEGGRSGPPRPHRLTPREAEVLQLIAEAQPNKGIAVELSISIKTIQKHRQRVMDKLHLHETASLTRYAIARGWWKETRAWEPDEGGEPGLHSWPLPLSGGGLEVFDPSARSEEPTSAPLPAQRVSRMAANR